MWIKVNAFFNKWLVEPNWFEPSKGFFELWVVRLTFLVIIALSSLVAMGISETAPLIQCYTATCFNNSVTNYKVPLGILSILIPIIAVFAANHRSEQTKRQIVLSQEQNNFTNYYKHLEEFEKFYKSKTHEAEMNGFRSPFMLSNIEKSHFSLFQGSRDGNYKILEDTRKRIDDNFRNAYGVLVFFSDFEFKYDDYETCELAIDKFVDLAMIVLDLVDLIDLSPPKGLSSRSFYDLLRDLKVRSFEEQKSGMPVLSHITGPLQEVARAYKELVHFDFKYVLASEASLILGSNIPQNFSLMADMKGHTGIYLLDDT
jgi:hypothetical protein